MIADLNLARDFRPQHLSEMAGQKHLAGPDGILTNMLKNHQLRSMIFHGDPGTGKTTAAMIMAKEFGLPFHTINATNLSLDGKVPDKKISLSDMLKNLVLENQKDNPDHPFVLYLDEIQYLNKKQQQLFLPYIESGDFILIASTADNPFYDVYKALVSRCTIIEFKPVGEEDIAEYLNRILKPLGRELTPEAVKFIAGNTAGDVRRAVNLLETALIEYPLEMPPGTPYVITADDIERILPSQRMAHYDKDGDDHYAIKSALQKSIRGSDPNAAVFYLCRLLEAGDMESACRRIMVIANEDIGLGNPDAIPFTNACVQMAKELGMPEAAKPLTNCVIYLALSRKCCTAESAYNAAKEDVMAGKGTTIPVYLRHACSKGYIWPHAYPNHWYPQQYLPDDIKDHVYYRPGDNTFEENHAKYHQMVVKDYYDHQAEYNQWPKTHGNTEKHEGD